MFFDSHAHYNDNRFDSDRHELLTSLAAEGISNVINVGADMESSRESIALADRYDFIHAAVGVHPHDTEGMTEQDLTDLAQMSTHPKVVAIGEIGLDYYYDNSPRDIQREWFRKQMALAYKLKKPVIIHTRDAMEDTITILKESQFTGGVLHCFSGSVESAKIALDMGYYISLAGPVTYKNARSLPEVAKMVPKDRLLIETDCPYLSPEPHRGRRNCSIYVKDTAAKIAELRGVPVEELAQQTAQNTKTLFGIE
ncbi:MAG: TatD family deoxyribonuclease [Ruminococcaceae bacterium]|nr:TatD family deoxyribonuclease [Oscillospiraceae bacterium]